jgi:hypothetical protein
MSWWQFNCGPWESVKLAIATILALAYVMVCVIVGLALRRDI